MMCLKLAEPAEGISEVGHGRIQRGGQGVRTPLKNHKNIGFLSNTGADHLKNHRATKPAFNVGPSSARQRNAVNPASILS